MTRPEPAPIPLELVRAPECAALSILEHALHTAGAALLAVNPSLRDNEFRGQLDRRELLADLLLKHVDVLQLVLQRYRDIALGTGRYVLAGANDAPF